MKKKSISGDGWEAVIYDFLDEPLGNDKDAYVEMVVDQVPEIEGLGKAGYAEDDALKYHLKGWVFSKSGDFQNYNVPEYKDVIKKAMAPCSELIEEKLHFFVFPTFNKHVLDNGGVGGYCQWKNTIMLTINPVEGWKKKLEEVVVHELCHALRLSHAEWQDVKDALVFEGMAECFRMEFAGGGAPAFVKGVSREDALGFFEEVMHDFALQDRNRYQEIFYGTGKFPLMAGHAIGYYIVKDYLESLDSVDWREVLRTPAHRIIIDSPFTTPLAKKADE